MGGSTDSDVPDTQGAILAESLTTAAIEDGNLVLSYADDTTRITLPPRAPGSKTPVAAIHRLQLTLETDAIRLQLNQLRELMSAGIVERSDTFFFGDGDASLVSAETGKVEIDATPSLDDGTIAIAWSVVRTGSSALLGAPMTAGRGALLGPSKVNDSGTLKAIVLSHVFFLEFDTTLRLDFGSTHADGMPRLSG